MLALSYRILVDVSLPEMPPSQSNLSSWLKNRSTVAPRTVEVDGGPAAVIELISGFSLRRESEKEREALSAGLRYPVPLPSNLHVLAPRDSKATSHPIWEYFVRVRERKANGSFGPHKAICLLCRVSIDGSSVSNLLTHMKTVAIDRSAATPMLVVATPSNAPVVDVLTADQAKNDERDARAEGNNDALVETKESFGRLIHVLVYRHFTLFSVPQAVDKPLLDNRKDEKNATRKKAKDGVSDWCWEGNR